MTGGARLRRRMVLGMPAGAALAAAAPGEREQVEWHAFRARFLLPEGRVVDTGNRGISHSEGQGWGMLFAVTAGDREAFDRILGWTARTLRHSGDALHAWRYVPYDKITVSDSNNATDGDLFISAALARAARVWSSSAYAEAAAAIGRDVLRLLLREARGRTLLLPGAHGFESPEAVVVNPSYYAFPALAEMSALVPSSRWDALRRDGIALIREGRFGRWHLPPDWLRVPRDAAEGLSPAPPWQPRFSYDAIRVPLYAVWSRTSMPDVLGAFNRYWASFPADGSPAWVDLTSGVTSPIPAGAGMTAVARLASASGPAASISGLPPVAAAADYYGAALILLCHIAWREGGVT